MVAASYVQDSFAGGEIAKSVQGQFSNPKYRSWMNVCLNGFPMEQEAWTRRPGSMYCGTTRNGSPGRVFTFEFKQSSPYTVEVTDGFFRYRNGPTLATTNDPQTVTSISAASPALVTTGTHNWATGDQVMPVNFVGAARLQNRVLQITVTGPTTFTIRDAATGANIDGATVGAFTSGKIIRILQTAAPYTGGLWSNLRFVQADIPIDQGTTPGAVLLHANFKPYVLKVETVPTPTKFASFSVTPISFRDGPYFDPIGHGALLTPSAKTGIITATITFPAYDATIAYQTGDLVASVGVNYRSKVDENQNNVPAATPTKWEVVSTGVAIGPKGFQGTDVGRLMRLYSEPPIWDVATPYTAAAPISWVSYPSGVDGGFSYWRCLVNSTGVTPGSDATKWALDPGAALWSWGRITGLTNLIDPFLANSVNIGTLTQGGNLAAAFDGITNQTAAQSASFDNGNFSNTQYVGKDYHLASAQAIESVTIVPPSDAGFGFGFIFGVSSGIFFTVTPTITINLRGKASAPANSADGTLLGTSGVLTNNAVPVIINSNDIVTTFNYVWVEIISVIDPGSGAIPFNNRISVAEVQFFNPVATGAGNAVKLQILGDKLLYTTPVRVWRLGLFSDTTGWPTCGTYHEGRLWLSGTVGNRIDGSKSNDPFNFAPTNNDGTVVANNAISYVFASADVNPIFWMDPHYLGIVCGTQAGEWLVQATSSNLPLTPTTIQAHRYTKYNCANILPARTNLTLMVVQTFKRELLEYFSDVFNNQFAAHDMMLYGKHLVTSGIQEIVYQQELVPIVWARLGNGNLIGITYSRKSIVSSAEPEIKGIHRHELGAGLNVESICVGADSAGLLDALVFVANDPVDQGRHVEMLSNVFLEGDNPVNAWFLDDAVKPTSTVSSNVPVTGAPYGGLTMNGLWHLNSKTVQVYAAGLDCGQQETGTPPSDFLVTNGSLFVPYGDGISAGSAAGQFTQTFAEAAATAGQIVVGSTYTSDGQIVRPNAPAESGARNGPAFGKLRRNQQYSVLVDQTAGLSIGTRFDKLDPVLFNADAGPPQAAGQFFSGIYRAPIQDDDTFDGMLCWRITRPFPATIAAIGAFIHSKDI
jgi:hypothetical protein